MRTECQFLGNEISVSMFDHLFFLHSSIVSPSSPSHGVQRRMISVDNMSKINMLRAKMADF